MQPNNPWTSWIFQFTHFGWWHLIWSSGKPNSPQSLSILLLLSLNSQLNFLWCQSCELWTRLSWLLQQNSHLHAFLWNLLMESAKIWDLNLQLFNVSALESTEYRTSLSMFKPEPQGIGHSLQNPVQWFHTADGFSLLGHQRAWLWMVFPRTWLC